MADTPDDKMTRYHHLVLLVFRLELTKTISCLTSGAISLYVGPKHKRYTVHKDLLTQYEWFRKRICDTSHAASQGFITLRKEDPKVFELLINWLYRNKLNAISAPDGLAEEEATLYVDLYLRACVWKIHKLQNALVDRLRVRQTCVYGYFPRMLIHKIYEKTEPQSPLRSYIVDSFLYKSVEWNEARGLADPIDKNFILTRKRALKNQLDAGNEDFVLDCSEALFQLCAKSKIRNPDRKTGCVYHTHGEGEGCGL